MITLDIAKTVFQVHGIDVSERVIVRKQLRPRGSGDEVPRSADPRLVGMAGRAMPHHRARESTRLGRTRLRLDACEGCEGLRQAQKERCGPRGGNLRAVRRPTMTFCAGQSAASRAARRQHCTRESLMRQRTRHD